VENRAIRSLSVCISASELQLLIHLSDYYETRYRSILQNFFEPFCSVTLNIVRNDAEKITLDLRTKFDILPVFSTRLF